MSMPQFLAMLLARMMFSPWAYEQILLAYRAPRTSSSSFFLSTPLCRGNVRPTVGTVLHERNVVLLRPGGPSRLLPCRGESRLHCEAA